MAHQPKPKAKHPASDHLRRAADALDEHHQAQMSKQPEEQMAQQPAGLPPGMGGMMPGGVSPLGGRAR